MKSALVGIFDTQAAAEQARAQLLETGFAASEVSMVGGEPSPTSTAAPSSTFSPEPHHKGALARFFDDLFGDSEDNEENYADIYQEAIRRGAFGVAVSTEDAVVAEKAEQVLRSAGAVDINQRAEQWRAEGWRGGPPKRHGTGF